MKNPNVKTGARPALQFLKANMKVMALKALHPKENPRESTRAGCIGS